MKKILILLSMLSFNALAIDMTMPPGPHQQMKRIMFDVTVPPATSEKGTLVKVHGDWLEPVEGTTVWTAFKMCVVDVSPTDKFSAQTWIKNMDFGKDDSNLAQYYFSHSVNTWNTEVCSQNETQPIPVHVQHNLRPSLKCINYDTTKPVTCHVRMYLLAK
jgi:hypothetical protein